MELKTARITLLIDPNKKAAFERLCAQQDLTASQVVRQLIRDYLAHHGVEYVASGLTEGKFPPTDETHTPRKTPHVKRAAPPSTKRRTERRKT
jgi:ribbon-helix-helix protein